MFQAVRKMVEDKCREDFLHGRGIQIFFTKRHKSCTSTLHNILRYAVIVIHTIDVGMENRRTCAEMERT